MIGRVLSIVRKEFIQIVRDPRTLGMTFVLPVIMMLLLGYAATTDVRELPLAVADQDHSPQSRALLDAFDATDYFSIAYAVDSATDIRALIDAGDARTGIVIPPGFGDEVAEISLADAPDGSGKKVWKLTARSGDSGRPAGISARAACLALRQE